ncbi:MAG: rRNA maturation RNase YbeY [Candidatus Gastranaerophilales bacterium]|nr:rRNA maturation RNase YbeY [Candidatus Gastranaerophilales bacterium]
MLNAFCENISKTQFQLNNAEVEVYAKELLNLALSEDIIVEKSCFKELDHNKLDVEFEILLCDNDKIRKINKEYRKIDEPTDVITFALFADSEHKFINNLTISLGQIIISLEKSKEQACENNVTEIDEFMNLLAHGVLHLIGIDHPDNKNLTFMLELQQVMIERIKNVKI